MLPDIFAPEDVEQAAWVAHEGLQADIFDHVLAVIPAFGLRVFQAPSGADIRSLAAR